MKNSAAKILILFAAIVLAAVSGFILPTSEQSEPENLVNQEGSYQLIVMPLSEQGLISKVELSIPTNFKIFNQQQNAEQLSRQFSLISFFPDLAAQPSNDSAKLIIDINSCSNQEYQLKDILAVSLWQASRELQKEHSFKQLVGAYGLTRFADNKAEQAKDLWLYHSEQEGLLSYITCSNQTDKCQQHFVNRQIEAEIAVAYDKKLLPYWAYIQAILNIRIDEFKQLADSQLKQYEF